MAKRSLAPSTALYPVPAVMVSCADAAGRANIITLAWVGTVCSEPPMVSISVRPARHSSPMIKETGEFVVNLPTVEQARATDICGMYSGAKTDKWQKAGLTPAPAQKVKAPLIAECPVNLECVVRNTLNLGTHDMFIGEIVAVHADESVLDARGELDPDKLRAFAFVGSDYRAIGEKVGSFGFSRR
jgi:flavin reductase (DIM6/NTAB) family NADH-FMN oxidoreductase RutF